MFKKILSWFVTDIHWKLLSLLAAVVLWVVGTNMNNPHRTAPFTVVLQLQNIDVLERDGLVLLNESALSTQQIRVTVRAPRNEIEALEGNLERISQIFDASIDFRAIRTDEVIAADGPTNVRMSVSVNLYPGFELQGFSPSFVEARIDATNMVSFPIGIEFPEGVVAQGFEVQPIILSNGSVNISGARGALGYIHRVAVRVNVDGLYEDAQVQVPIMVFNQYGEDITNTVSLNINETTAFVRVWPIKAVPLQVETTGDLANNFTLMSERVEPQFVNIVGPPSVLDAVEYVTVSVDLSGQSANFVRTVMVHDYLPEGVHLVYGEPGNVRVYVAVEQIIDRGFLVPRDNVRVRASTAIYQVLTESEVMVINVRGPRSLIDEMHVNDVELEIDLRGRPIGDHWVPVMVTLPEGVGLSRLPASLHIQIHEPAALDADNNNDDEYEYLPPPQTDDNAEADDDTEAEDDVAEDDDEEDTDAS